MRDQLKALEALQTIDVQIAELLRSGEEHPRKLAELESQLGAARGAVETERSRLTEIERQKKTLEEQLAADKDKVKKWEGRLSEQRSTREYSALAREIDIAKKQNETASEEVVELARQAEAARSIVSERETSFKTAESAIVAQMQTIRAAMADIDGRRKNLDEKRAEAAKAVPASTLRKYEVIQKKRTTAIVPVVAGACRGCNMNLPPQMNNELRATGRIDSCPSCFRMIYAAEAYADQAEA
ncbi:zinc ribbon domain-containing protein [Vulgatibacter sp.]|uniref:zinc ribbon domain-containing protein n=1 Tax=Vulgatibacter sp. TaxID=1971226 RepID=UPI00356A8115